ncbi:hypothetical protein FRB95_013734 [Tulasnella sp. JGI-2019a]|nr:hypothetical protein FRB95_013734 [Tulasnella sp. JGI-2019a]
MARRSWQLKLAWRGNAAAPCCWSFATRGSNDVFSQLHMDSTLSVSDILGASTAARLPYACINWPIWTTTRLYIHSKSPISRSATMIFNLNSAIFHIILLGLAVQAAPKSHPRAERRLAEPVSATPCLAFKKPVYLHRHPGEEKGYYEVLWDSYDNQKGYCKYRIISKDTHREFLVETGVAKKPLAVDAGKTSFWSYDGGKRRWEMLSEIACDSSAPQSSRT